MKRFCVLLFALIFSLSTFAVAYGDEETAFRETTEEERSLQKSNEIVLEGYNEYDYIVAARTEKGFREKYSLSEERYEELTSNKIEEEFLYRASLPRNVLKEYYCYTDEQIDILKAYQGDRLETCPEMRILAATLALTMRPVLTTDTRMTVLISWSWSAKPTVGSRESLVVTWDATYEDGLNNNMRFDSVNSTVKVEYLSVSGTEDYAPPINSSNSVYYGVSTQFSMDEAFDTIGYWAKSGDMYVCTDLVNQTSGPRLYEYVIHCEYGSYPFDISYSIDILSFLSINYGRDVNVIVELDGIYQPHENDNGVERLCRG